MKSKALLLALTAVAAVACTTQTQKQACPVAPLSQLMVESHGLVNFDCNKKHKDSLATSNWDYVSGLVANSILKVYEEYPEKTEYLAAVKGYADYSTSALGDSIFKRPGNKSALGESNIDDLAAGKIFFGLYHDAIKRGDSADSAKYRNAVTMMRNKLKFEHARIPAGMPGEGGFFHKKQYPYQMWLDGLYMGPALYAQWQHEFGDSEGEEENMKSWSDIALQFKTLHEHTWDASKELCYHAWSAAPDSIDSFWAMKEGSNVGCNPEFWGRSMGWYFAALCDVLEWMPKEHPDYQTLVDNFNAVAKGLARWQDESGVWYQLLQYDNTKTADGIGDEVDGVRYNIGTTANYLESSASCMFCYVYYKGIRLGLLDKDSYLPVAEKAFDSIQKEFIIQEENGKIGIDDICASAGLGPRKKSPSRTGTVNYYLCGEDTKIIKSNEGKGIGTFIMAALENELSKK